MINWCKEIGIYFITNWKCSGILNDFGQVGFLHYFIAITEKYEWWPEYSANTSNDLINGEKEGLYFLVYAILLTTFAVFIV